MINKKKHKPVKAQAFPSQRISEQLFTLPNMEYY